MKTLPKSIVIGPLTYKIEEVNELYDKGILVWGVFVPSDLLIQIEENMPEQRKPITLWHEIIHAILNHSKRTGVEEDVIDVLALEIVGVLQANAFLRESYCDKDAEKCK